MSSRNIRVVAVGRAHSKRDGPFSFDDVRRGINKKKNGRSTRVRERPFLVTSVWVRDPRASVTTRSAERRLLVDRHNRCAAEAEVVLERNLRAFDLTLVRLSAELPVELGALGEAGGAEGVTLGDEPA